MVRPVLSEKLVKKIDNDNQPSVARKVSVSALFEESGAIAPVYVRRFGTRAGEIIARGTRSRKSQALRKVAGG